MLTKPSVFISYARDEGEKFAKNLRKRLQKALPQIEFWRGRSSMQGGLPWWAQLAGAISRTHCLILMMTPAAMASPSVDDEYSYAWRQGVHGCPRRVTSDDVLKALFPQLPRWIKRCHFHAIQAEWGRFVAKGPAPRGARGIHGPASSGRIRRAKGGVPKSQGLPTGRRRANKGRYFNCCAGRGWLGQDNAW